MKEDAIKQINDWREVLKDFLNPFELIDKLPQVFKIGSSQHNKVLKNHKERHEAVGIIIDEVIKSEMALEDFISALGDTEHKWLAPLVKGNIHEGEVEKALLKQENLKYVRNLLSIIGPHLEETIRASDVAEHLYRKEIITKDEQESIQCKVREDGNCVAVKFLLSHLVRKPPGWWLHFTKVLQDLNYSDDLTDLLQDLPTDDSIYYSSDVREKRGIHKEVGYAGVLAKPNDITLPSSSQSATRYIKRACMKRSTENEGRAVLAQDAFDLTNDRSLCQKLTDSKLENSYHEDTFESDGNEEEACEETLVVEECGGCTLNAVKRAANSIIPKEALYDTPLSRSRQPVRSKASLRAQERKLSEKPVIGENVIICGPESSDKTRMIVHIIQSRFPTILDSTGRKILFVVPKINKDHIIIEKCFGSEEWSVGYYEETTKRPLTRIMQSSQVIMITPNALLNWLLEEGKITEFDMLIFDGCETASQDGPYKAILIQYLRAKQMKSSHDLPQVIGLTSNFIFGKIGKEKDAVDGIKYLCSLFDAKGGIEVAEANLSKNPTPSSKRQSKKLNDTKGGNCVSDSFTWCLCEAIEDTVELLYKLQIRKVKDLKRPNKLYKGSREYIHWCKNLSDSADDVGDKLLRSDIKKCARRLTFFNRALMIKNKCTSEDSLRVLETELRCEPNEVKHIVVDKKLNEIVERALEQLRSCAEDPVGENPSLHELENTLREKYSNTKNTRTLLVVEDEEIMEPLEM